MVWVGRLHPAGVMTPLQKLSTVSSGHMSLYLYLVISVHQSGIFLFRSCTFGKVQMSPYHPMWHPRLARYQCTLASYLWWLASQKLVFQNSASECFVFQDALGKYYFYYEFSQGIWPNSEPLVGWQSVTSWSIIARVQWRVQIWIWYYLKKPITITHCRRSRRS